MGELTATRWGNRLSYLLSIIGFVIGLGNFWLFPTNCFKNGGSVYLIPYTIFIIALGLPLVYLELLMGQILQKANLGIYKQLCHWLKGVAYSVIIMNFIRQTYYNTVIAWALNLLFASTSKTLPWANDVISSINHSISLNGTYFIQNVLGKDQSIGINDLQGLQVSLIPCLIIVFAVVYLLIRHGAASIGPSVYVTATLPYLLLITLLIKAATLPGAKLGIKKLFEPKFEKLKEFETWRDAATQVCYSLGPGSGVLVAYASYADNKNMNIKSYALIVVICNALTSILCGFALFCGLGYFVQETQVNFESLTNYGYAIIFVIYPLIISQFKAGWLFSILFFSMIFRQDRISKNIDIFLKNLFSPMVVSDGCILCTLVQGDAGSITLKRVSYFVFEHNNTNSDR